MALNWSEASAILIPPPPKSSGLSAFTSMSAALSMSC